MVNIQPQFVKLNDNEELPKEFRGKILYYYAISGMIGTGVPAIYVELNKIDSLFTFIKECEINPALITTGTDYFQIGIDYYISNTLADNLEEIIDNITNEEISDSTNNIQQEINRIDFNPDGYDIEDKENSEGEDEEDDEPENNAEACPICGNPLLKNIAEGKSKECPVCGWFEYYDGEEEEEEEEEEIENNESETSDDLICILPDYILEGGINTEFFDEVNNAEYLIDFYIKKNRYRNYVFNEDELNNFYVTFCLLIINLTAYTDRVEVIDQIYNQVLNYFANFKTDEASIGISLMLNNMIMQQTVSSTCGCNNTAATGLAVSSISCYDYYKNSMLDYIKSMLGNTDFYKNWFFVKDDNYCEPNEDLCDYITKLIEEFITLGYDLSFSGNTKNACNCPVLNSTESECNYKIINNYLQVINWIANNQIDENTNKIKIYGEQFGELLPKLQF